MKWIPDESQLNTILTLYKTKSVLYIAKQFGKDRSVIIRILKENNIHIKNLSESHRLPVDEYFFDKIDTEEKAYWLGFIYADGYITKCNNHEVFGIKLNIKDLDHLVKFKKAIKSDHKIIKETINSPYGVVNACAISIRNKVFVDCLQDKGVFYNKSKILQPPPLNKIPNELLSHFIRGYYDGDGSVYQCKAKKDSWKPYGNISFLGTKNFLTWILDNLKNVCLTTANIYKYKDKDVWEIKIGGNNNFLNLYNYLYKNATVYLDRKKEKADSIKIDAQTI